MITFHWEGLIISSAVLLPNLLAIAFPPSEHITPDKSKGFIKILEIFERIGQVGYTLLPMFVYTRFKDNTGTVSYIGMAASLIFYYICWSRYFIKKRKFSHFFSPIFGIPIPMALSPIAYMTFASVGMNSWIMGITVLIFSIGHIPISYKSYLKTRMKLSQI